MSLFYVYEFWRPDKDLCFYVGKGKGHRAYVNRRYYNDDFMDVLDVLAAIGMCAEVRMIQGGLSEDEALAVERNRIAFWQSAGVPLVNRTDGGKGTEGYRHSERTRQKISQSNKGKILSQEARAQISKNLTGRKASPETRAKMSATRTGRKGPPSPRKGKKRSAETCAKMSAARKGHIKSPEWCAAISEGLKRRAIGRKKNSNQLVLL